jgi:predicted ATPase
VGDSSSEVNSIAATLPVYRSTGATMFVPYYLLQLANGYAYLGRFDDAWRCIGDSLAVAEASGERWCTAEISRVAGEIELLSPTRDASKALEYFEHALAIAREQQARSLELRAAVSASRLLRGQGRGMEAHDLLAPVYGWFTEGFSSRDLKEAKALLDELS